MTGRIGLVLAALLVGIAAASLIPALSHSVRQAFGLTSAPRPGKAVVKEEPQSAAAEADRAATVKLAPGQIAAAGIDLGPAGPAILTRRITAAGTIVPHA